MQGFPFDSQLSYDETTGEPIYDRAVSSQPLRKLIRELFTTGVMPNPSTNLQVSAGLDGMTVQVNTGFAVVDGGLCRETEVRTLEVTAADNTYDRIDTVVLRWNENVDARTADLYVVAGTPAATPVRPELQRDNSIYEIGLADVFVTKRVATITNDKITDTRYEAERCGIVSSISEFDTTTLYQQVQADLASFKSNEESEFNTWFDTIRGILDEDVAGHLQGEIEDLQEEVNTNSTNITTLNNKLGTFAFRTLDNKAQYSTDNGITWVSFTDSENPVKISGITLDLDTWWDGTDGGGGLFTSCGAYGFATSTIIFDVRGYSGRLTFNGYECSVTYDGIAYSTITSGEPVSGAMYVKAILKAEGIAGSRRGERFAHGINISNIETNNGNIILADVSLKFNRRWWAQQYGSSAYFQYNSGGGDVTSEIIFDVSDIDTFGFFTSDANAVKASTSIDGEYVSITSDENNVANYNYVKVVQTATVPSGGYNQQGVYPTNQLNKSLSVMKL